MSRGVSAVARLGKRTGRVFLLAPVAAAMVGTQTNTQVQSTLLLVVEDDADARRALRDVVETHGWDVLEAGDGAEALRVLGEKPSRTPNAIVLDLYMPVMDGWQFLQEIERTKFRDVPVVVLTASEHGPGLRHASAFLRKPVPVGTLLGVLKRHAAAA